MTSAHIEIIGELRSKSDVVKVMPVIFLKDGREVTSKSFPYRFEVRKEMLEAVFKGSVEISRNYTFHSPFSKYMPPLLSPKSWRLRRQILSGVEKDYFSYTGDTAEGYMLKMYRLNPKVGARKKISATSVKEKLYRAAAGSESNWRDDVPPEIAKIIEKHWSVIEGFAKTEDQTTRVVGMKFPKDGY